MKKILVPVDFSDCSLAAADIAIQVASKAKAEIYFLHLYPEQGERHVPTTVRAMAADDERKKIEGSIRSDLNKLVSQAEHEGLKATAVLAFTKAQEWIEDYVRPYKIDLVVMGSHGLSGFSDEIVGSTTVRFIRHANVPVLVIKKKIEKFNIRRIVFASDFKIDLINIFREVINIASLYTAAIHLLYICTPYHFVATRKVLFDMKRFMHQFRKVNYTPHVYNAVTEAGGVHEFSEENQIDLIVLTTRGRTGFFKMFAPSIAENIVKQESTPLLVVNIKTLKK
ncbi:MAG TPA: universal stress protein [Cyclobacteriaceae bacterium]|nr:universal stress protein [Cyclobacteriaceae bacterium]